MLFFKRSSLNKTDNKHKDEADDRFYLESIQKKSKRLFIRKVAIALGIFVFFIIMFSGAYTIYIAGSTFDKITGEKNSISKSFVRNFPFLGDKLFQLISPKENESTIEKIKNDKLERLNILILGIRGVGDPNGGLLADTIIIATIEPQTGKAALISIPRDLYVKMPNRNWKSKINEAYALGIKDKDWKNGLEYAKEVVSNVTGLDIHYAVSVDFGAFKEIIDTLGGVTITLDKPFTERNQFAEGIIDLPAGRQVIDGDTALLFVRARFSTSDFDRSKRQQQILIAIKEKALGLGVLSNPVKIVSIFKSLESHIRTDAELWEIQELAMLAKNIKSDNIKRKVFDTSENGLLYASKDLNGAYILLPNNKNFDEIKEACRDIFEQP